VGLECLYFPFLWILQLDLNAGVVYLWIGAGTMVEYTFQEAIDLLESQHTQTIAKIEELQEDLYFLRGNSITVEVNMARLFNHSVKLKKIQEATAAEDRK
jgi:prefoldin subunit 5